MQKYKNNESTILPEPERSNGKWPVQKFEWQQQRLISEKQDQEPFLCNNKLNAMP